MHVRKVTQRAVLLIVLVQGALALPARGQVYRPEVPIDLVAHEGGPVPGIDQATFDVFLFPEIDAQGNVLFVASMSGPGIDSSNDVAMWFGQPGAIQMVAREGDRAPDMPPGVIYDNVAYFEVVSETGWIAFTAELSGPGITEGVNDTAVFCGPPGDFQKVLQAGDPAPGFWPGVEVTLEDYQTMGAYISDNGTLFIGAGVTGPDLSPEVTRAYWIGPRDSLELMIWEGMPVRGCPECDPDVVLLWADEISFNDAGQMAYRGGMFGPGINPTNDTGRWLWSVQEREEEWEWQIVHREGDPAPEFGEGVTLRSATSGPTPLNRHGDKVNEIRLQGSGITGDNDWVLVAGQPDPMDVVIREGDATPEAGEDVYVAFIGLAHINDLHRILYYIGFGGPPIDDSNQYGVYYGPYADPRLILRGGTPAPYFPSGTVLYNVGAAGGLAAMNDVGDFAAMSEVESTARGRERHFVLWMWCGLTGQYVPVLEPGADLNGRTVGTDMFGYLGDYWMQTGGSDGLPQSFNDQRQLAIELEFADGTRGIYRIGPPLLGDTDGDGLVTLAEMAAFSNCMTGPGGECAPGCEPLDFDLDGDIDQADFRVLQALLSEAR